MDSLLRCPSCGEEIELSKALSHQINEQLKIESELKFKEKLTKEMEFKIKDKENEMLELKDNNKQLMTQLLELNRTIRELKNKDDKRELELQKELARVAQNAKIEAHRQSSEEYRLKDLEKEKKISDLVKEMEILKQKAQQGSQQSQGEVLELDFERELKENFPRDEIVEVKKGIRGADVIHIVKTPMGKTAGKIIWEIKRTKNWEDKWIDKLKSDQRDEKAEIASILSQSLPKESKKEIEYINKVWVATYAHRIGLANLLREQLLAVAKQKAMANKTADDAQTLFDYMTSNEFSQQMEAVIETYLGLNDQITKEKMAFEKQWKQREMQLNKMYRSILQIAGSIAGIAGQSMPQIKGIDLGQLESGEK